MDEETMMSKSDGRWQALRRDIITAKEDGISQYAVIRGTSLTYGVLAGLLYNKRTKRVPIDKYEILRNRLDDLGYTNKQPISDELTNRNRQTLRNYLLNRGFTGETVPA